VKCESKAEAQIVLQRNRELRRAAKQSDHNEKDYDKQKRDLYGCIRAGKSHQKPQNPDFRLFLGF